MRGSSFRFLLSESAKLIAISVFTFITSETQVIFDVGIIPISIGLFQWHTNQAVVLSAVLPVGTEYRGRLRIQSMQLVTITTHSMNCSVFIVVFGNYP